MFDTETIEELKNRGLKVTTTEPNIREMDIVMYKGINFVDLVAQKSHDFYIKHDRLKPNLLFLGWATYIAVLSWIAQQKGTKESIINEPELFDLDVLVLPQEHGFELGFSDNGKSAELYYKEFLSQQLNEGK